MESKLIVAVCGHPELYDTTIIAYRDRRTKEVAWRKVSEDVGLPSEVCKRKWKNLRDTYLRETKKLKERSRSGAGAAAKTPWRFMTVMGFLAPFVEQRETSSNIRLNQPMAVIQPVSHSPFSQPDGTLLAANLTAAAAQRTTQLAAGSPGEAVFLCQPQNQWASRPATQPAAAAVSQQADMLRGERATPRSRDTQHPDRKPPASMRRRSFACEIAEFESKPPSSGSRPSTTAASTTTTSSSSSGTAVDEDELFLSSLLPDLKSLPKPRRALVKLKIHQLIYEAGQEV